MDPRQKQNLKYLELSPADLAKVNRNREKREANEIDEEQLLIAEFGKHYGYEGVRAILNNELDSETVVWLLLAARKLDHMTQFKSAQASFIGAAAAKAKKPSQAFKKATEKLLKLAKADF